MISQLLSLSYLVSPLLLSFFKQFLYDIHIALTNDKQTYTQKIILLKERAPQLGDLLDSLICSTSTRNVKHKTVPQYVSRNSVQANLNPPQCHLPKTPIVGYIDNEIASQTGGCLSN